MDVPKIKKEVVKMKQTTKDALLAKVTMISMLLFAINTVALNIV